MADIVIIAVLALIVFFILRGQLRGRKKGQCGGGCSGCAGCSGSCGSGEIRVQKRCRKDS